MCLHVVVRMLTRPDPPFRAKPGGVPAVSSTNRSKSASASGSIPPHGALVRGGYVVEQRAVSCGGPRRFSARGPKPELLDRRETKRLFSAIHR